MDCAALSVIFSFLLTHPSRGATLGCAKYIFDATHFYSHTPRGVQPPIKNPPKKIFYFYSHTPRGVQRHHRLHPDDGNTFLLTHPSRGATPIISNTTELIKFLLTHPSRGATYSNSWMHTRKEISTHTPLAGCNRKIMYLTANCTLYNVGVDFFKNLY